MHFALYFYLLVCSYIWAILGKQVFQWQITFSEAFRIQRQNSLMHRYFTFVHCRQVTYAIILFNIYVGKEFGYVSGIVYDRIAWTLGSRNILTQYVFRHKVLYISNGCILGAFTERSPYLWCYFRLVTIKENIKYELSNLPYLYINKLCRCQNSIVFIFDAEGLWNSMTLTSKELWLEGKKQLKTN